MTQKTALIVGATQPAAEHLAVALARQDWTVIAVGEDEARLLALARLVPDRIDALHMSLASRANAERLGRVWGDEPVHFMAQFQPIALTHQITLAVKSVMLITGCFGAGLRAGGGINMVALPRARDPKDVMAQAAEGAHARALRALALSTEKSGFRTVGLLATSARGKLMAAAALDIATGAQPMAHGAVRGI